MQALPHPARNRNRRRIEEAPDSTYPAQEAHPMRAAARGSLLLLALLTTPIHALADNAPITKPNYDLASRWTPAKAGKLVYDTAVAPHWLEFSDRFWYSYETSHGRMYYLVDPRAKSRKPLFDNAHMAAMLTRITLQPYDAQHLPIRTFKFINKDTAIRFELDYSKDNTVRDGDAFKKVDELGKDQQEKKDQDKTGQKSTDATAAREAASKTRALGFEYDLAAGTLTLIADYKPEPKRPRWASVSPDEKTIVFARGYNLYMMDADNYKRAQKKADDKTVKETQLTTDGEEHYSYASRLNDETKKEFQKDEKDRKDYRVPAARITWSKDSRKFALDRSDERKVADLWVINSLANPRPTLETYRYGMPGEENQPQDELLVFDVAKNTHVKLKADRFKDQSLDVARDRTLSREVEKDRVTSKWLGDASDKLYFTRVSRDRHRLDVCLADTETGDVKVLIEERLNTYIDEQPLRLVRNGKEILFWSERDGWGHYYLFDETGKLENQVDSGEFVAQDIVSIDEKSRSLVMRACGRESGEDPYYMHLYRINFDGSNLKLLDPGDASHAASMDDDGRYFVDNFSRIDAPTVSQLRDSRGNLLLDLDTADVSALVEAGFKYPEPFKVKADDGVTDLYGVIFKPFDFDPRRKYPVIEYVYPGPQTEAVQKTFNPRSGNQTLAQFGFIVVEVGNRGGNPQRSKWYHNFGYGNLRDYGLADKKRAVEELALKYPWIDVDRVGIYGHSGGGFMSTAAMLVYPDFYKVAVSESGNHENNIYNRWWSETHNGVKEVTDKDGKVHFEYSIDKNSDLAANLKGHLLLSTGDIDDNVHPGNTLRMANALIRANKRFDLFVLPGQRHAYGDMSDYWFWIRSDYFCKHLLGQSDDSVDILQLDREKPRSGKSG
jgi:dipeptidyl-peptidase 4